MNLKRTLAGLAIAAGAVLVVAIGATVVMLIAAGLGALLSSFLPFSTFETSLLALIATLGVTILAVQIFIAIARFPALPDETDEVEDLLEEWEEDWEDTDWDAEDEDDIGVVPPLAQRHEPLRRSDFEKVGRNDPCPCGSGRKYKNCHGRPERLN